MSSGWPIGASKCGSLIASKCGQWGRGGGGPWYPQDAAENNSWSCVCWSPTAQPAGQANPGLFAAVSTDGTHRVMTSPDGVTWTPRTAAEANAWSGICWGNGLFVAVATSGTHRVMTSPDGVTWTPRTAALAQSWVNVCWSADLGMFCAVAVGNYTYPFMTSTDGTSWSQSGDTNVSGNRRMASVCAAQGLLVAVAQYGALAWSSDGVHWNAGTQSGTGWIGQGFTCVCYSSNLGIFVAVGQTTGTQGVGYSSDGKDWRINPYPAPTAPSVTWGAELGLFCAVLYGVEAATSSSGSSTWNIEETAQGIVNSHWTSVCYSSALQIFCAVSNYGAKRVMIRKSS